MTFMTHHFKQEKEDAKKNANDKNDEEKDGCKDVKR